MTTFCILGNQLFAPEALPQKPAPDLIVFMREDRALCTHFRYHKHKIIFFLAAMRKYAEELRRAGYRVHYERLGEDPRGYMESLGLFLRERRSSHLEIFEVEDKFFEDQLEELAQSLGLQVVVHPSPMFLTSREQLLGSLGGPKKPFMKTFYESQRKRLGILLEPDGEPVGGRWSYDEENRKPLPRGHEVPAIPNILPDEIDREVMALVAEEFADHPGQAADFWLPTDRSGARAWARDFFDRRFAEFGPYEDALSAEHPFLFHSVLTPFLNTGLITPRECVSAALRRLREGRAPLASVEGFIRQIIGWREFIRGIYQCHSETQEARNFFNHHRRLSPVWYRGGSGVPPLDDVLGKTLRYGYAHHIERLMVVGSLMLLLEIAPHEAHRWFMELFVDSSDWVMGPNVYGMALFSDGGLFATKPYFCGSNYYRKMGRYPAGSWQDGVDGLYWGFIHRHRDFFAKNHRLAMMVRAHDKLASAKRERLSRAADELRSRLTLPGGPSDH